MNASIICRPSTNERKFALHTFNKLLLLCKSDVVLFKYSNEHRCWHITLTSLSIYKLKLSTTAKEILNINNCFIQISQNCILNIDYLASIENKTLQCTLCDPFNEIKIFASRRYFSKIKSTFEII